MYTKKKRPRPHPICGLDRQDDQYAGLALQFERSEYCAYDGDLPTWISDVIFGGELVGLLCYFFDTDLAADVARAWPEAVAFVRVRSWLFDWIEDDCTLDELRIIGIDDRAPCTIAESRLPRNKTMP